jgi:hypothetical protein
MPRTFAKLLPALLLLATAAPTLAEPADEVEELRQRLEKLEARPEEPEGFSIATGKKVLTISGALEIEANYTDTADRDAESAINVATAQINFDATVSDQVKGRIALLHEDVEEPAIAINEAYLELNRPEFAGGTLKVTAGKAYLPFGAFASSMVSDPLTLELGESNRNLILTGWQNGKVAVQFGAYNGDHDTRGQNVIDNGVAALTLTPSEQISFGASYLCDLAESNANLLADAATTYEDNVNAASAYLTLKFVPLTINFEYLGALKLFSEAMLADPAKAPELTGRQPRTWFAEATFAPHEDWALSGRYEKAKDYQDDVARYGATFSYGIDANTTLSLEYLYSDFARESEDQSQQFTVQLALEF